MRKNWYTLFLLLSLVAALCYSGGHRLYEFQNSFHDLKMEEPKAQEEGTVEKEQEEQPVIDTGQEISFPAVEGVLETPEAEGDSKTQEDETAAISVETQEDETTQQEELASLFGTGFQDVLLIGDSRTVGLYEYGQVGEAEAFADNGMSVFNLWKKKVAMKEGEKMTLEQVLSKRQYQGIHFMLGINELGYTREQVVKKYRESVEKVHQMQPFAKIVLGANLHVTAEKSEKDPIFNNENIDQLNQQIKKLAKELNCYYLDVNVLFDDKEGNLAKLYSTDGAHVLGKYYMDWVLWIQNGGRKESPEAENLSGNSLLDAPSEMNYN